MSRKLKRPNGEIYEEYLTSTSHEFHDGKLTGHCNDTDGEYTGRICFKHKNGNFTRWYTASTAPKWLYAMWQEATE